MNEQKIIKRQPNSSTVEAEHKRHIVVEVGPQGEPMFNKGSRQLQPNERYIAVEKDGRVLADLQRNLTEFGEQAQVVQGDARHLPFRDQSIHELVFMNVFGDCRTLSRTSLEEFLAEARRVLMPGGLLRIIETLTPTYQPLHINIPRQFGEGFSADDNFYRQAGFAVHSIGDSQKELSLYDNSPAFIAPDAYYLFLQKINGSQ